MFFLIDFSEVSLGESLEELAGRSLVGSLGELLMESVLVTHAPSIDLDPD